MKLKESNNGDEHVYMIRTHSPDIEHCFSDPSAPLQVAEAGAEAATEVDELILNMMDAP